MYIACVQVHGEARKRQQIAMEMDLQMAVPIHYRLGDPNPGLLQEVHVAITAEPSLQSLKELLKYTGRNICLPGGGGEPPAE